MEHANFMKISMKLLSVIKRFNRVLNVILLQVKSKVRPLTKDFKGLIYSYYKKPVFYTVIIPTIIFGFYMILITPNRWVAESKVVIKDVYPHMTGATALGFIINELNPISREDAFFLKEYIYSYDMFEYLNHRIKLCKLYRHGVWDPFSRLFRNTSKEEALEYYKSKVAVILEENSGVLTITTQGFNPQNAQIINKAILERSEWFLNDISQKIAKNQKLFFDSQVKVALTNMQKAQQAMITFQTEHNIIHPLAQTESGTKLVANLMAELAAQEAELKALGCYLTNNAPQVISLENKIDGLKKQIDQERKMVAGGDTKALNSAFLKFQNLEIEEKLAEEVYKSTLALVEQNNLNSSKQFRSLVIISAPTLPEKAVLPKRLYNLLLFFILVTAVYGTIKLILTSIKEHV